jgi:hypothetical protein
LILAHGVLTRSDGPNAEVLDTTQPSGRALTAISIESNACLIPLASFGIDDARWVSCWD